jgi:hypothetical protein
MSGQTAVALAGILTSGVVGPAVFAWFAGRRQRREQEHEVEKERREVLDEAAASLSLTRRTNHWVVRLWRKGLSGTDPQVAEANAEQRASIEAARVSQDRLTLRFGPKHPLVAQYVRAQETLDEIVGLVQEHASRGEAIDPFVSEINEIGRRYTADWDEFIAMAHEWTGGHEGARDPPRRRLRLVRQPGPGVE